eukprot:6546950-Prymnesium_polylepis.1
MFGPPRRAPGQPPFTDLQAAAQQQPLPDLEALRVRVDLLSAAAGRRSDKGPVARARRRAQPMPGLLNPEPPRGRSPPNADAQPGVLGDVEQEELVARGISPLQPLPFAPRRPGSQPTSPPQDDGGACVVRMPTLTSPRSPPDSPPTSEDGTLA